MKILFPERIEEFSRKHADAKEALERYVFNVKGNNYRTVVLVVFFAGTVAIRFIGTHSEYDKIKDIKNI